ncbi:uncharacterized protein TEOVI_000542800 [Trypanosoma equiperdum]|uniref:Uncharacterized protein n=2 Tax=Trypanozoon TaxID=39700 RepID=Q585Q1_TRYB2|nr:hypothetical protein, conserved [Trypanosoma brucei brucei TREU927]AAX79716.1 hypothetical protein, conserved [Trypanosoma brucei]AAZ11722.1 hypothetical protein, conserved [Trypanosoma brucei brucei TREU927]SCU73234.1 conserved protein [Trypanosoma equiperdum]
MLRLSLIRRGSLQQSVRNVSRTPAYLRRAPPGLYITCDYEYKQRHATMLVDVSSESEPPLTNGAYLLASSGCDDTSFREARSVLFASPVARNTSEAVHFADAALRTALSRNGMALPLDGIQTLVIPEFHPLIGHAVRELLSRLPRLKIACNAQTAAFISDGEFFKGVVKTLRENDRTIPQEAMSFANVSQENLQTLEDGSVISTLGAGRQLQVVTGDLAETRERWRRERKNKLKHFESYALFVQDPAFQAMHVPSSVGVHLSWVPLIVPEVDSAALLLLPDYFAAQKSNGSSLLEVWRLRESLHRIVTALKKFPETQRVLTTSYGEIPGGAGGYLEQLRQSAQKLEELRSRLGHRLATDTGRDMEKWSALLSDKIFTECLLTTKAATKTTPEVLDEYKGWATAAYCGRLARTLAHAAATLPPDPVVKNTSHEATPPMPSGPSKVSNHTSGTKELKKHFEKHGMASLCPILDREDIDITVFLAMNTEDFKKVFRATFGVVRKMELLQQELRAPPQ